MWNSMTLDACDDMLVYALLGVSIILIGLLVIVLVEMASDYLFPYNLL